MIVTRQEGMGGEIEPPIRDSMAKQPHRRSISFFASRIQLGFGLNLLEQRYQGKQSPLHFISSQTNLRDLYYTTASPRGLFISPHFKNTLLDQHSKVED